MSPNPHANSYRGRLRRRPRYRRFERWALVERNLGFSGGFAAHREAITLCICIGPRSIASNAVSADVKHCASPISTSCNVARLSCDALHLNIREGDGTDAGSVLGVVPGGRPGCLVYRAWRATRPKIEPLGVSPAEFGLRGFALQSRNGRPLTHGLRTGTV